MFIYVVKSLRQTTNLLFCELYTSLNARNYVRLVFWNGGLTENPYTNVFLLCAK